MTPADLQEVRAEIRRVLEATRACALYNEWFWQTTLLGAAIEAIEQAPPPEPAAVPRNCPECHDREGGCPWCGVTKNEPAAVSGNLNCPEHGYMNCSCPPAKNEPAPVCPACYFDERKTQPMCGRHDGEGDLRLIRWMPPKERPPFTFDDGKNEPAPAAPVDVQHAMACDPNAYPKFPELHEDSCAVFSRAPDEMVCTCKAPAAPRPPSEPTRITIKINRWTVQVARDSITPAEIRSMYVTEIPPDHDIWQKRGAGQSDTLREDGLRFPISEGDVFFSAPKFINQSTPRQPSGDLSELRVALVWFRHIESHTGCMWTKGYAQGCALHVERHIADAQAEQGQP